MSDEIKEEILDAPLVVHKKGDASYKDGNVVLDMNETHIVEEGPTLERHRFKKDTEKKRNKFPIILIIIVIIAGVFCALYFTGNITFGTKEETTKKSVSTTEATTSLEEAFAGTIVVKGTYIFVDSYQVDGIKGLQEELKYIDPSETAYKIIDEDAYAPFLNDEILPLLMNMGFYGESTEIVHQGNTGLMAEEELTTVATTVQIETSTEAISEAITE